METERDHGIHRCPGLRMFIARAIFCICSVLHTFANRCFEYERGSMHFAGVIAAILDWHKGREH